MGSLDGRRVAVAALFTGLLLAGCSSTTNSSPSGGASPSTTAATSGAAAPAPSPTSALCQDAANLRASVDKLTHIKVGKGTADEIKSNLADVQAKLTALTAELHGEFTAQTSAMKSAVDAVRTAVSNLTAQPSASTVTGVVTALRGVATATSSLLASLTPKCGSGSGSASP